jgi:hypothetical protein
VVNRHRPGACRPSNEGCLRVGPAFRGPVGPEERAMRTVFVVTWAVIVAGLAFYTVVGAMGGL